MTIAMGVLIRGGMLIGADRLVSHGTTKTYRKKVHDISPRRSGAVVMIAAAGHESPAKETRDAIKRDLAKLSRNQWNDWSQYREILDQHSIRVWKRHVRRGSIDQEFWLLMALWTPGCNEAHLLVTDGERNSSDVAAAQCIGIGQYLGQFFANRAASAPDSLSSLLFAIQTLHICEEAVPDCGGPMDLFFLSHAGELIPIDRNYITLAGAQLASFDSSAQQLLFSIGSPVNAISDQRFQQSLDIFNTHFRMMRELWSKNPASVSFVERLTVAIERGALAHESD